jgi:predicted nucleotidyltransferase
VFLVSAPGIRDKLGLVPDSDSHLTLSAARDVLLAAFPDAWAIYVYGSFARGDEVSSSDIDLALLLPPEERIGDLLALLSDVSTRVHREVDLVDLRRVSDVLRREVLAEGRQI